jgi:hypothetical protein
MANIFWLGVAVYFGVNAYKLGLGHMYKPGAGLFIFVAAVLLLFFSSIDLAGSFLLETKGDTEKMPIWSGLQWQKILFVTLSIAAYIYFFNHLGFLCSTFLLMTFIFKVVGFRKWGNAIFSSLIITLIFYVVFKSLIGFPFPSGFLGF